MSSRSASVRTATGVVKSEGSSTSCCTRAGLSCIAILGCNTAGVKMACFLSFDSSSFILLLLSCFGRSSEVYLSNSSVSTLCNAVIFSLFLWVWLKLKLWFFSKLGISVTKLSVWSSSSLISLSALMKNDVGGSYVSHVDGSKSHSTGFIASGVTKTSYLASKSFGSLNNK